MPEFSHLTPNVAVCGQLKPEDLAEVAKRGFRAIVNNRPEGEAWIGQPPKTSLDEAATAAGIACHHITFTMPRRAAEFGPARSAAQQLVEIGRRHRVIEIAEGTLLLHLARSIDEPGHGCTIE